MDALPKLQPLNARKWEKWKVEVKVLLMHYGSWRYVDPSSPLSKLKVKAPETTDEASLLSKESIELELRRDRAYTIIHQCLNDEFKSLIEATTDGAEAWRILTKHFEPKTRAHVIQLLDEFFAVKYQPGESVGLFLSRVKLASARLREVGHAPQALYEGYQMIRSLPGEFQPIIQSIYRWSDADFVPDKVEAELILEENRLAVAKLEVEKSDNLVCFAARSKMKSSKGKTFKTVSNKNDKTDVKNFNEKPTTSNDSNSNSNNRKIGPCFYCKSFGHLISDCKKRLNNNHKKSFVKSNFESSNVETKSNFSSDFFDSECSLTEIVEANSSSVNDNLSWVFDSAATAHFCNNRSLFLEFKPVKDMQMTLAVGAKESPVLGIGTVRFQVFCKGKWNQVTLGNVLYNPQLRRNLLSGVKLEKAGAHFVGTKGRIVVYDRDWKELFYTVRKHDLYFLKPTRYSINKTESNLVTEPESKSVNTNSVNSSVNQVEHLNVNRLWHFRFCHVNSEYVTETSKNNSVKGLPNLSLLINNCIPCKLAKSKRVSFRPIGKIFTKGPLELLHMDLCGPLPVETQGGNRYFFTIIDDFSRRVTVFPIRNKFDAFSTFLRFQKRAERFLNCKILAIRTDGGGEFCNDQFNAHLEEQGISREKTNPYSPEMNGVAERFNLTALDAIKTLLKDSGVPQKFWGEALLCFSYVWNRVCHKSCKKTPFELYSGRKPSVSHLKRFGSLAYVGVPKQNRTKLDMRAKLGIMMGYAQKTKGYRIWLIEENKLVETINVRFDETKKGVEFSKFCDEPPRYPHISFDIPDSELFRSSDGLTESDQSDSRSKSSAVEDKGQETLVKSLDDQPQSKSLVSMTPCSSISWFRKPVPRPTGSKTDIYYGIEGVKMKLLRSFNEVETYCKNHDIEFDKNLFNFSTKCLDSGKVTDLLSKTPEANLVEIKIPRNYREAMKSPESFEWKEAMNQEINVMHDRKVWELVAPPKNAQVLGNKWVFTVKRNEKNEIQRYKARLVAQGFQQIKGESFDEVFSPVVNFSLIRLFFSIFVCFFKWYNVQLDINNAYLYADLDETIFMRQPEGYIQDQSKVCLLRKSIYGLHQSARQWFHELDSVLIKLQFERLSWCNCVYVYNNKVVLLLYVDDIVIFSDTQENLNFVITLLKENFDLKVLGETRKLLGVEFEEKEGKYFIHQQSYIESVCKLFQDFKYPICSLPIPKGQIFSKLDSPTNSEEIKEMSHIPYRNLIGCLSFIASRTRPDIMYAVNLFSQFQSNPGLKHWHGLLKLLGYLKYTKHFKLELSKITDLNLSCYSDADFAANRDDRVSMGGYILFLDGSPISWRTFKQKCVSLSTMEAEYVSLTESAKELVWIINVLRNESLDLNLKDSILYCDNQAAIGFSNSPFENHRTKHIDIRYHFLRNLVYDSVFQLKYVNTKSNLADIFTKPLTKEQLNAFCKEIFQV